MSKEKRIVSKCPSCGASIDQDAKVCPYCSSKFMAKDGDKGAPTLPSQKKEKFFTTKRVAKIAIFSACAFVLYMINIPIAILFPSWLKINLSDFPALIGGFSMGPLAGGLIVLVKILIKLPFTSNMCVGELSDLINGLAFVLPSSFFYRSHKTKKGAVIAILIGSLCSILTSILSNRFAMIPLFLGVFHYKLSDLVSLCPPFMKVTEENFYSYYIFLAVVPFNILRCVLAGLITMFTYKPLSGLINKID